MIVCVAYRSSVTTYVTVALNPRRTHQMAHPSAYSASAGIAQNASIEPEESCSFARENTPQHRVVGFGSVIHFQFWNLPYESHSVSVDIHDWSSDSRDPIRGICFGPLSRLLQTQGRRPWDTLSGP